VNFVRTPEECFSGLPGYPFASHYLIVEGGLRMHYVDEGPAGGEPILLLHGQPTWSYLYRSVIPALAAQHYRVIAPDLIGYGRSDKPSLRSDYSVRAHIGWLGALLDELDLRAITGVVQDWGGPIGLGAFSAAPERLARLVATNTALHTADPSLAGVLEWACHTDGQGKVVVEPALLDYQRMTQELPDFRPSLFVQGATERDVEPEVLAGYDAPFPDETHCAGARQMPLLMGLTPSSECARRNRRSLAFLSTFGGPVLTAFSDSDPATSGWGTVIRQAAPGAHGQPHSVIAHAGHFVQEDAGPALAEAIADFVGRNPL
jgi:haloalkane dehalogenase